MEKKSEYGINIPQHCRELGYMFFLVSRHRLFKNIRSIPIRKGKYPPSMFFLKLFSRLLR
jgi:hypothetical protein